MQTSALSPKGEHPAQPQLIARQNDPPKAFPIAKAAHDILHHKVGMKAPRFKAPQTSWCACPGLINTQSGRVSELTWQVCLLFILDGYASVI